MNDEEIGELTKSDIPARSPQYWQNIQATLAAIDAADQPDKPELLSVPEESMDTDDEDSRPMVMNLHPETPNENRLGRTLVAAAAVIVAVGLGALLVAQQRGTDLVEATDDGTAEVEAEPVVTTSTTTATTSTTVTSSTTTPTSTAPASEPSITTTTHSPGNGPVNEAESDLKFDFGLLLSSEVYDNRLWISFDRGAFGEDQAQGPQLESEPRYELATDFHGGLNQNPLVRTYPMADEFEVLEIDATTFEAACGGDPTAGEFVVSTIDQLLATAGADGSPVSLTFSDQGEVTLIRDQRAC